jgi:hypothetical protein
MNNFEAPDGKSILWRYMDFSKYVSLLYSRSLYFCRADKFEDPFEGARGYYDTKEKYDLQLMEGIKGFVNQASILFNRHVADEFVEEDYQRVIRQLDEAGVNNRERFYVCCWHENKNESEAMWNLYSRMMENAIAIKTTAGKLEVSSDRRINIGKVKYTDYKYSLVSLDNSIWFKRKSFEHEKEVRAVIQNNNSTAQGLKIKFDLNSLITEVVVSPTSPHWFVDLIKDLNKKYQLNKPNVSQSELVRKPFY